MCYRADQAADEAGWFGVWVPVTRNILAPTIRDSAIAPSCFGREYSFPTAEQRLLQGGEMGAAVTKAITLPPHSVFPGAQTNALQSLLDSHEMAFTQAIIVDPAHAVAGWRQ